ncbi:MAG: hypothetical protein NXH75_16165 [Halobacteriovoraceae bacterium]|jgi:hypothetical protein|nr:hypothetical protein [Halobacteriovoraceae bacterium]
MSKFFTFIFLVFLSGSFSLAQETKKGPEKDSDKMSEEEEGSRDQLQKQKEEPRISNKWYRGNYLIYDCSKGNYVCVNDISFLNCGDQRQEDIDARVTNLKCAPLKRFGSQEDCFKAQYSKIHNQMPKLFCTHPRFR